MYEAKYRRYITKNQSRFAEPEDMMEQSVPISIGKLSAAAGVPIYYDGTKLYLDDQDNHTAVIGPTGCKKTRVVAFSTLASIIERGESAVINDPKGELYRKTAARAKAKGANVFVLNFRRPSASHMWNPLLVPYRFWKRGKVDEAVQAVADFSENVMSAAKKTTVDIYWAETAQAFLNSATLMLMDSVTEEYFNIKNLFPLCYQDKASLLAMAMKRADPNCAATMGLRAVLDLEAEKTKSCVYSTLLSALNPFFRNQSLANMLSGSSFSLENLGEEQTLVYLIYPDEKDTLNFLVNAFLTQCYETLVFKAAESKGDRLPVRVNFLLDEFANLPSIPNFANRISEARSKNIRFFLMFQSFGQLQEKYKDCAETILANCNNWICFSSRDMAFLNKLACICGKEVDYNGLEHDLVPPCTMQHLRKGWESCEVLIVKNGCYPFVTDLPDFDHIPMFVHFKETDLPTFREQWDGKVITPKQWLDRVIVGTFRQPFADAAQWAS